MGGYKGHCALWIKATENTVLLIYTRYFVKLHHRYDALQDNEGSYLPHTTYSTHREDVAILGACYCNNSESECKP